jgi:hypothetical protein
MEILMVFLCAVFQIILSNIRALPNAIDKYVYIENLHDNNETLYHAVREYIPKSFLGYETESVYSRITKKPHSESR